MGNWGKNLFLITAILIQIPASAARVKRSIASEQRRTRIKHAHELLGRYYKKSSVRVGEDVKKINGRIYRWTYARLPKKYRRHYQKVAQTVIDEALRYGFDPVFLMSVIEGESSWRPDMIGGVGEVGLMQIRPTTAAWITKKLGLRGYKGKKTLLNPVQNIKIGAAYLSYLRDRFDDHARLYLAAYNMGATNVRRALKKDVWPKDYPSHVMKIYVEFYQTIREQKNMLASAN